MTRKLLTSLPGDADLVARAFGQRLHASLGRPIIVSNGAGATGAIGSGFVAKSATHGHAILLGKVD